MSTTLTNDQITAGAAVLGDNGQPVGRNAAIMVFDAMATAGAPVDELADAEAAVRFTRAAPAVAGADLDLSDLARLFASSHETGKPVLLSASACGLLFDAMTTAAPAAPLEERQRAGLMANTERKRGELEQRGYGVIGYVMQGARGDRCTVAHGAVNWLAEQRSVADMIRTPLTAADFSPESARTGRELMDAWNADAKTLGAQAAMRECPDCDGTGRISSKELCARCDHSGILPVRAAQPDGDQGGEA